MSRQFFSDLYDQPYEFRTIAVILLILVVVSGIWGFMELTDEIMQAETQTVDSRILEMMRNPGTGEPVGPSWLPEAGRDITALGSTSVLLLLVGSVVGFFLLQGKYRDAVIILSTSLSGVLMVAALKWFFSRERPDSLLHMTVVSTNSYPSGHTMMSAVIYLSLAAMLAQVQKRRATQIYSISVALGITLLVGLSRIYLGVHYPTDVLAGWSAGLAWAGLSWFLFRIGRERRQRNRSSDRGEHRGDPIRYKSAVSTDIHQPTEGPFMADLNMEIDWEKARKGLKERYAGITDKDLEYEEGNEEKLMARLQEKTGRTKEELTEVLRPYRKT